MFLARAATMVWPLLTRRMKLVLGAWLVVPFLVLLALVGVVFVGALWMARQNDESDEPEPVLDSDAAPSAV